MVLCFVLHKAIICCTETTQKKWISVLSRKLSISCATCSNAPAAAKSHLWHGQLWIKSPEKSTEGSSRSTQKQRTWQVFCQAWGPSWSQALPRMLCQEQVTSLPKWEKPGEQEGREGVQTRREHFSKQHRKTKAKAGREYGTFQQLFPHILFFSRDSRGPGCRMVQLHHKKVEHSMARRSALPQLHQPFGFTSASSAVTFPQCLHYSEAMPLPT